MTHHVELRTGSRVCVDTKGDGDELIVFLHPVGGDRTSWQPQLDTFSSRYACASVDLRGHGTSTIPGESVESSVHVEGFADDILALIEVLGYRRAHLVGLSMGGVVALEAFRKRPDHVQSLTLANTWAFHAEAEARIAFMEGQLSRMPLPESSAQLIPGLFAPGTDPDVVKRAVAIEAGKRPEVFLASWRSMFRVDYRGLLPRIDVPVLLVGGTADVVTPTDPLLTEIFAKVATSRLVQLEGAGHFSNLDHPEAFSRALAVHLGRSRSGTSQRLRLPQREERTFAADTTAHALMRLLALRGVEYFFSNSGTDFTPIIDALARYHGEPDFPLKEILVPHENTAIAMAHGYALLASRPAVVMAHVNVGTANMGLGLINASRSRVPLLVLAGRTPWTESGMEGGRTNFVQWGQDTFDQGGMFREFTKWDYELKGPHNLENVVDRALAISRSDPAGPVYLTLPKESLCAAVPGEVRFGTVARQQPAEPTEAGADAVERAARILAAAKRPLVITAELGRTRGGVEALVQLATRLAFPVVEHGKRNYFNFPTHHSMHVGFSPSPFVEKADVVLCVDSHVPWIPALSGVTTPPLVIQVGTDPLCQDLPMRSFPADLALAGSSARTLARLTEALERIASPDDISYRRERVMDAHARVFGNAFEKARQDGERAVITKAYLSYCIGHAIDDDVVIFNEYNLDPQLVMRRLPDSWFENSIASGLGWALGAALGAQLARPEQTMVVTLGDGTYLFNTPLSAHHVAGSYRLPILIIVFNDGGWSTIKKSYLGSTKNGWAERKNDFPLCHFELDVAYEKLAEACGGIGMKVEKPAELPGALETALATVRREKRHVLLNVVCERD